MTLRTKTIASGATIAVLTGLMAAAAAPAHARWIFHDPSVGEAMIAPPGGTRADTCADRVRGWSGYSSTFEGSQGPLPPEATATVTYEVWRAPEEFDNFDLATTDENGNVVFPAEGGGTQPASRVGTATTNPRTKLEPPQPWSLDPGDLDQLFVIAAAPITVPLHGVEVGDRLGLTPEPDLRAHYVDLRVINCSLPVLDARVNVLPASPHNVIRPHASDDRLPVRIFGTRRLKVAHITEVHLGEAAPLAVGAPRDLDRDGFADRVYTFRQFNTDIQCYDTAVKVTGKTSDRVRFQARSQITIRGCLG
jgi:hypothetical protein